MLPGIAQQLRWVLFDDEVGTEVLLAAGVRDVRMFYDLKTNPVT